MYTTFEAGEGRTLSYFRTGAGPLVVCVPGGPGMDPEAYFATLELPGHELLVFAPRGVGASSPPSSAEGYRMAGYVQDVESLRVHLDESALTIYGNSHGGSVALAYAGTFPEHVKRLAITNAPPGIDADYRAAAAEVRERFSDAFPDGAERLAAAEQAGELLESDLSEADRRAHYRRLMAQYVARQGPPEAAHLDRLCSAPTNWDSVPAMYAEMTSGLDLLRRADRIMAPTLVSGSEFDVVVPASVMRRVADALPNGRYVEFSGVGHFPEVEAVDAFRSTMLEFLSR